MGDHVDLDGDLWEDIPDSESGPMNCAQRWRNAGPEGRKKMFGLFEESGIFIGSCRHRMVIAACDMIKSGELYVAITNSDLIFLRVNLVRSTLWLSSIALSIGSEKTSAVHTISAAPFNNA